MMEIKMIEGKIKSMPDIFRDRPCKWDGCEVMVPFPAHYCDVHQVEVDALEELKREVEAVAAEKERKKSEEEIRRSIKAERDITFPNLPAWLHKIGFPTDIAEDASGGFGSWLTTDGNTKSVIEKLIQPGLNIGQVTGFPPAGVGWWFYGPEGGGKTGIGARLMVEILLRYDSLRPRQFRYLVWPEVWRQYNRDRSGPDGAWNVLDSCVRRVIFLDEVLQTVTEAQVIAMKLIISGWIDKGCCVIIATNAKPSEMEIAERDVMLGRAAPVTSRLRGILQSVPMTGSDFRLRGV